MRTPRQALESHWTEAEIAGQQHGGQGQDPSGRLTVENSFFDNIGYIIVFILFVLPRILKLIKRPRDKQPTQSEPEKPQERPVVVFEEEDFDLPETHLDIDQVELSDLNALVTLAEAAQQRARGVSTRSGIIGSSAEKLLSPLETAVLRPINTIAAELKSRGETGELPTADKGQQIAANLDRLSRLTDTLEFMVDRRMSPQFSEILIILDVAAEGCLFPYLAHSRRFDLDYKTRQGMVVLGETGHDYARLFSATSIAPIVINEKLADLPFSWVHIPSDVALDVFHSTYGLARKIMSDSRILPVPLTLSQYSDSRSFTAGLMNGWQPRLFADVNAALQLGPAFAAGLSRWLTTASESDRARTIYLNDPFHVAYPPLYVRMFVALSVLSYMGLEDDGKQRFEDWNNLVGNPSEFIVVEDNGTVGSVSAETVLDAVSHFVDYLMRQPLEALGGYPVSQIPRLRCGPARVVEMEQIAGRFLKGEPVAASVIAIIGAAQLAVEKSNAAEGRVGKAARRSLSGEGEVSEQPPAAPTASLGLTEMFRSDELLARAIVAGAAIAPRTARGRRRL